MVRWGLVLYGVLGAAAVAGTLALRSGGPLSHPAPWLPLEPAARHLYSLALGLSFGGLVVIFTPWLVARVRGVRALHQALRPVANSLSPSAVVLLALTSGLAEELFFRGLLAPHLGLVPQAILFGLVHYAPAQREPEVMRRSPRAAGDRAWRFTWVFWAGAVGLVLGAMFQLTGSLAGPIAAHALINWLNLRYLRRHDPEPPQRSLGGLLGQRSPSSF
jgi:membrane protease YdiL (CAAX protease family)